MVGIFDLKLLCTLPKHPEIHNPIPGCPDSRPGKLSEHESFILTVRLQMLPECNLQVFLSFYLSFFTNRHVKYTSWPVSRVLCTEKSLSLFLAMTIRLG